MRRGRERKRVIRETRGEGGQKRLSRFDLRDGF